MVLNEQEDRSTKTITVVDEQNGKSVKIEGWKRYIILMLIDSEDLDIFLTNLIANLITRSLDPENLPDIKEIVVRSEQVTEKLANEIENIVEELEVIKVISSNGSTLVIS